LDFQDRDGGVSPGWRGGDGGPGGASQGVMGGSWLAETRWGASIVAAGAQLGWAVRREAGPQGDASWTGGPEAAWVMEVAWP
jgi:hypothetical protein